MTIFYSDSASFSLVEATGSFTGSFFGNGAGLTGITAGPTFIDNLVTVGLAGSDTTYNSISESINSITDASATNTYTVQVFPGVYIENPMVVPSYVAVRGDTSISTIVSASNPNSPLFTLSDQSMIIDMQIQGVTGSGASAVLYSSATTPQTNAISYVENVRFGTNYTHASVIGVPGGNCIMQCSNVKYGGFTDSSNKSFDIGFRVSGSGGGIGRMQLRNVTSTNGGITGSSDQIFGLADASGCTFIVNGCLLTKAVGSTVGTGFKVYNGGSLRLTGVNFQRWAKGIWAPQTGSGPSIDAIALNFENCTTDVLIEHSGSTGKVQGTDTFLKTSINLSSSLYEVGQDPRRITVAKKGGDFTSISASVAWITDSGENNRYVIEVGPGQFTEKEIDLTGRPYVSIVGSSIQTTQIFPSSSTQHLIRMGINNEVSFLSLTNAPTGYSALYIDDVGDYAQAHKVSFYDCDTCITVLSSTQDTKFYGEYIDFNGVYRTGSYVSSSNGFVALASLENYYQFPVSATGLIANYGTGGTTELDLYAGALIGESDATSVAIRLENGADLQGSGFDIPYWGTAVYIPNLANSASFNIVGTMIHDSVNYDFDIQHPSSSCRYQGTADHSKINPAYPAPNFFFTFLDETDGELDITRNLAVTFQDGTHTDASTLIFRGSPMGVMEGGQITTGSNGYNGIEVNIAAGFGYLETATPGIYKRVDWNAFPDFADTSDDSENYVFVDDNGTILASGTEPDNLTKIVLGRVYIAGGRVIFIDQSPRNASHTTNLLSTFNRTALGPVFANGGIVSANGGGRLDATAGTYFFGENQFKFTGGASITFTRLYRDTGASDNWNKLSTADVPTNTWDSGSNALVALSSSYYRKDTFYLVGDGPEEKYFLVIGQEQFSSLVAAEGAGLATPPNYFTDGVVQLAAVYVQSGSGIVQVEDIRPTIAFRAGGVNAASDHGNLLGLSDDDHTQYLLVNGTRAMTGPLTASIVSASSGFIGNLTGTASTASYVLGSNVSGNITGNASNITSYTINQNLGTSNQVTFGGVTASLQGTASYVTGSIFTSTNPVLSASYALTASYALNGGGGSGAVSTYTNGVDNNVITSTGAAGINGESNLTFNGSTLAVTGNITATSVTSSFTGSFKGDGSGLTGIPGGTPSGGAISGSILIELFNGGIDLTTGVKDTPVYLPYGGTVTGWEIMAYDTTNTLLSTSCVVDILSDSFANLPLTGGDSIAGTEKPTLSSQSTNSDNTISSWSALTAGYYIQAEIESISVGVSKVVIAIKVTKS